MAKRTDSNQTEIMEGLRRHGVWVCDTHELSKGFPDIVTWYGIYRLIEIKMPSGRLTPSERTFRRNCPGPLPIVRTLAEALALHGIIEEGGNDVHHMGQTKTEGTP